MQILCAVSSHNFSNQNVLVSNPMKKFNKATGKSGNLAMHEQLEYHKDAVVRSMSLCESLEHPESSVPYKISSLNKELYDKKFSILKSIVKAIIFCGKQKVLYAVIEMIAHLQQLIKDIFLALLHLMAETDTVLKDHLEQGKRNAKCTSKTTQK